MFELRIPEAGESIQEVQIGQWLKEEGQWVEADEEVVELETDKASMELPAPGAGVLVKILKGAGEMAELGELIGQIDETAPRPEPAEAVSEDGKLPPPLVIMPAAQRLLAKHGLQARDVKATGPEGRLLKEDVVRRVEALSQGETSQPPEAKAPATSVAPEPAAVSSTRVAPAAGGREEEVVAMSMIRRRIAERLVQAQSEAALLTTFNEIDMSAVMALRKKYRDPFEKKHGVRLGFMSFFVKAVIEGLKECPQLNAEIRDREIVYRNYFDIGVAIGGGKGLVVPMLRNAERMSFAEIEKQIGDFAARAKVNKIRPDELEGGTFTITNGGIYGSLLSTPIVNPPQSGVLGMHAIQERPVAREGEVVIRPMMYVAVTYDHRLVDGREAVTFLRRAKEILEDPSRMLLET
ncbi:MAG: 2-oxoglutarate dehydrogenase complex dihydrolipoyllysine-residue succinyltransferase [Planctomycetes bacterium]|nr:2-oxoglutarate dehydrogenase complex dihydrolipoyllysine-residue succinyltransferase [Planctomycetota bacterium]